MTIKKGEELELQGQTLCEDCSMDQLSPPRMCDPWAVYTAKSFSDDSAAKPLLTEQQHKILEVLKETGGINFEGLVNKLGVNPSELKRALATLRHMEKIKASMRSGEKILVLW
jgi:hypothetical protein